MSNTLFFGVPCRKTFAGATLPATLQWWDVEKVGSIWVAGGQATAGEVPFAYSTNGGATWSAGTADNAGWMVTGIAHNGTVWAGYISNDGTKGFTSSDGQTWDLGVKTGNIYIGTTGNGFVAIGTRFYMVTNLAHRHLFSSSDGLTFTQHTDVFPNSGQNWMALATNGTYSVAVSGGGTGSTSVAARILNTDLPGSSWTQTAMSASALWRYVIHLTGDKFFAVASAGIGAISTDAGATWSALTLPTSTEDADVTRYGVPCATTSGRIILPIETVADTSTTARCYMSCDDGQTWINLTLSQQGKWSASGCDGSAVVIVGTDTGSGSAKAEYAS